MKLLLILLICGLCGCNIHTTANTAVDMGRVEDGVQLSDFGGNVAYAASTDGGAAGAVLSSYSTSFENGSAARQSNIEIASKAIDKKVVGAGETFSFNDAVGPTKKETGFKLARIFIKGKDAKGYGGGVCQVSSTLYNAAKEAGLPIVERHPHTKAVSYVPEGGDAATSYGYKDLKFTNNKSFPVMINSRVDNGKIIIEITAAQS